MLVGNFQAFHIWLFDLHIQIRYTHRHRHTCTRRRETVLSNYVLMLAHMYVSVCSHTGFSWINGTFNTLFSVCFNIPSINIWWKPFRCKWWCLINSYWQNRDFFEHLLELALSFLVSDNIDVLGVMETLLMSMTSLNMLSDLPHRLVRSHTQPVCCGIIIMETAGEHLQSHPTVFQVEMSNSVCWHVHIYQNYCILHQII